MGCRACDWSLSPLPGASMGSVRVGQGKVPTWMLQQVRRQGKGFGCSTESRALQGRPPG